MWNLTHFHELINWDVAVYINSLSSSWFKTVWILYIYCYSRLSCGLLSGGGGRGLLQTGWFPVSDAAWEISDCLTAGLTAMLAMYIPSEMWRTASCPVVCLKQLSGYTFWMKRAKSRMVPVMLKLRMMCQDFFFQDVALIFIKHYYSWHSWEKNDIKAVLIFILKEIFMNEPNDLYYFVPLKKLIEQPRFSKSYQSLIHLANCFLGFEGSATTYNLFHGRFTILILFYRTQIFQWDER